MQTSIFAEAALEAKSARDCSEKQYFEGRPKPKNEKPIGTKSDKCQKRWAKESSFEGLRGPKSEFLKAKCLEPFFKNVLPTEGGEHIFEKKCEIKKPQGKCKQNGILKLAFLMQIQVGSDFGRVHVQK